MSQKQGETDDGYRLYSFWSGIIVCEGATNVYKRIYRFNFSLKCESKRNNYASCFYVAVLNLSNGDMHNLLETRSETWYGF